eukprot:4694872-Prymnesium_polylepis.1
MGWRPARHDAVCITGSVGPREMISGIYNSNASSLHVLGYATDPQYQTGSTGHDVHARIHRSLAREAQKTKLLTHRSGHLKRYDSYLLEAKRRT